MSIGCLTHPASCALANLGGSGANVLFSSFASWVAGATGWVWRSLGSVLSGVSAPSVVTGAAGPEFARLAALSPLVALTALIGGVLAALRRGDAAQMARDALFAVPLVAVAIAGAVPIASLILSVVNALCSAAGDPSSAIQKVTVAAASLPAGVPGFGALLLDLAAVIGALLLWFELVVRDAILSLLLALAPMVIAASLFPPLRRLALRLVETFVAVALVKFVVVVCLDLGATAVAQGPGNVLITGLATVLLATLTPFAVLRVVPLLEYSALHALEGTRQRTTQALRRGRSAGSSALERMNPIEFPGPLERPDDLGFDEWPITAPIEFPEDPPEPPKAPIGRPTLRHGHPVILRDEMGPQMGWHWDD